MHVSGRHPLRTCAHPAARQQPEHGEGRGRGFVWELEIGSQRP